MKKEKKRIGRPPAKWMFEVLDIDFADSWTDAYEISEVLKLNTNTVKSFLGKLHTKPKHVIENGVARARYRVSDLKIGVKGYVEPWT